MTIPTSIMPVLYSIKLVSIGIMLVLNGIKLVQVYIMPVLGGVMQYLIVLGQY